MTEDAPTQAVEVGVPVNITRLTHEAASRSAVLWIRVPDGRSARRLARLARRRRRARGRPGGVRRLGPGEQSLPWLPDEVELLLRSKDTGGRLLTVHATVREVPPDSAEWDAAVEVLRPERLNAVGDVAERWRQSCTIHVLTPHGRPVESPGAYAEESGRTTVDPAGAATAGWRPWHWRGRAGARRNVRGT